MSWSSRLAVALCAALLPAGLAPVTTVASTQLAQLVCQVTVSARLSVAVAVIVGLPQLRATAGAVVPPAEPLASKRKAVKISASALPSRATVGQAATIAGVVTAAAATRVRVQQRSANTRKWHTVRTIAPDDDGRYVFAWTPSSRRPQQFRVLQSAHGVWKAGTSRTITMKVNPAPAEPVWHSVSLGFEDVVLDGNVSAQRTALRQRLDAAHVNRVQLAAGRVEWTAFDWPGYPRYAADSGTDHLGQAITDLTPMANGGRRSVVLTIDALMPSLIAANPSWAGQAVDGRRSQYLPSASALHDGAAGDRIVALARYLAATYRPDQIAITELVFGDETFGSADLALYRRMTGARDWPRTRSGAINTSASAISSWRSSVLYDLLARVRRALDEVAVKTGHRVELAQDVRVNWAHPTAGRPESGADYRLLGQASDDLVLWAYFGTNGRTPTDVGRLATAFGSGRFTISIGLWAGADEQSVLSTAQLLAALRAAAGVESLNVTPQTLLTAAHWQAIAQAWPSWPH